MARRALDNHQMATTTLKAIIDRLETVCEGATLGLQRSRTPFSLATEPNAVTESAYYIEDAGLLSSQIGTSDVEFRVDQVRVWVASRLMFDGQTRAETLQTTLVTMEQLILADGPANSYHAHVVSRDGPSAVDGSDVMVAGLTVAVDYDYSTV